MQLNKRRILYIEDHDDTSELVKFVLEQRDYQVVTERSVEGALKLAQGQTFDLFILDSWLTDGSGADLCRKIREFDNRTPILFYSAAAYASDKESAIESGAQAYLIKPSSFYELCELVSTLINGSASSGANGDHRT